MPFCTKISTLAFVYFVGVFLQGKNGFGGSGEEGGVREGGSVVFDFRWASSIVFM